MYSATRNTLLRCRVLPRPWPSSPDLHNLIFILGISRRIRIVQYHGTYEQWPCAFDQLKLYVTDGLLVESSIPYAFDAWRQHNG